MSIILISETWTEILRTPGGTVFRKSYCSATKKSVVYSVGKIEKVVMFLSKEYLDSNIAFPLFRTLYTPDFLVMNHYGLRNTTSWWSKDLASVMYIGIRPWLLSVCRSMQSGEGRAILFPRSFPPGKRLLKTRSSLRWRPWPRINSLSFSPDSCSLFLDWQKLMC
jgi:hypothetical protein